MVNIKESCLQSKLVKYIKQFYPKLVIYSIPNEIPVNMMRSKKFAMMYLNKLIAAGLKPGIPDLHIPHPAHGYLSYYIEMKQKGKKPTPAQLVVHEELRGIGHKVEWFDDYVDAIKSVDLYLRDAGRHLK